MNTLSIDTTSEYLVLALSKDEGENLISGRVIKAGHNHSEILIPALDELMEKSGVTVESVKKLAVVVGPGSFTGIRIGLTFARTFALAMKIPLAPVTTFEAIASSAILARRDVPDKNNDGKILILINALLPLVHWAVADIKAGGKILPGYNPRLSKVDEVLDEISKKFKKSEVRYAGGSALLDSGCADMVRKKFFKGIDGMEFLQKKVITHPDPRALALLCAQRSRVYNDPQKVEPLYLKDVYLRK